MSAHSMNALLLLGAILVSTLAWIGALWIRKRSDQLFQQGMNAAKEAEARALQKKMGYKFLHALLKAQEEGSWPINIIDDIVPERDIYTLWVYQMREGRSQIIVVVEVRYERLLRDDGLPLVVAQYPSGLRYSYSVDEQGLSDAIDSTMSYIRGEVANKTSDV